MTTTPPIVVFIAFPRESRRQHNWICRASRHPRIASLTKTGMSIANRHSFSYPSRRFLLRLPLRGPHLDNFHLMGRRQQILCRFVHRDDNPPAKPPRFLPSPTHKIALTPFCTGPLLSRHRSTPVLWPTALSSATLEPSEPSRGTPSPRLLYCWLRLPHTRAR